MLSDKVQNALNEQVSRESYASNYYLAMASWCDHKGLPGSAKFLYDHSGREREHMMKLFHYVNAAGGHSMKKEMQDPPFQFQNLKEIFELTLAHERQITGTINALVDLCLAEKDHSTFNFLQWYVAEQHEEEKLFKLILDKINMIGIDGRGLYWIDKEIGKLAGKDEA
jgi:ferritin